MIEDQIEAQRKLKDEYGRQIEAIKIQTEHLNNLIEELQKEIEQKMAKKNQLEEENNNEE